MKVEFGGFQALPKCEEMWLLQGCLQAGPSLAVCRAPSHPSNPPVLALGLERRCVTATVHLLLGLLVGPLALLRVT